jgi:hypothetical protein
MFFNMHLTCFSKAMVIALDHELTLQTSYIVMTHIFIHYYIP